MFRLLDANHLELLFEGVGLAPIGRWQDDDGLGRTVASWNTLLFVRRDGGGLRAVDQIEGILTGT